MKIISQTVVSLSRPKEPKLRAYCSATFIEGSGNIPKQLQNLKERLDEGFVITKVEQVSGPFEID